jgi:solute carrier family 25 protein 42
MAAIIGVVIYQGISFSLFTRAKEIIKENDPSLYQKWYVDFFIGAFSAIGQIIAYPLDILRKRMQGQALLVEKGELAGKQNYKELIHDIYTKERGCRGFYKGVTLNLIKAPLASASAWTIKNFINRKLNKFYDF